MRECKEKWQLCLIVSVRVHLGQPRPRAGLRSPWNLTGAFFFPRYQCCWRVLTWVLLLWTQISFFCEVMHKLGEKKYSSVYPRNFCFKSIDIFSSLLLTSGFAAHDLCPIMMLCISFKKHLAGCAAWICLGVRFILGRSVKLSSDSTGQTSTVLSSLAAGRWMYPVAV